MNFDNILYELTDGVAVITFNRPKSLNALNNDLLDEFSEAIDAIDGDASVRVLILTGAGEKAFVAGADITELATCNTLQAKIFARKGHLVLGKLEELSIPVIAAVNGFALGGGSEIALACDFVYASETATFGLPEITLGLIPGFGGTQRLPRLIGTNMAKELIYTGRMVPAAEAYRIGLANKLCAPEVLIDDAMATAQSIASKGRVALRSAKQAINDGINVDLSTGCNIEINAFALCMASQDGKEGTTAFVEKRKAVFRGSLID